MKIATVVFSHAVIVYICLQGTTSYILECSHVLKNDTVVTCIYCYVIFHMRVIVPVPVYKFSVMGYESASLSLKPQTNPSKTG
jgi:hypothetical protein